MSQSDNHLKKIKVEDAVGLKPAHDITEIRPGEFKGVAFKKNKARLVITGNEIFNSLIEDKFEAIVRKKMELYGSELVETVILPDDRTLIKEKLIEYYTKNPTCSSPPAACPWTLTTSPATRCTIPAA